MAQYDRYAMARQIFSPSGTLVLFMLIGVLSARDAAGQTEPQSPADVIRYLTYQSNRPDLHGMTKGHSITFSCGPVLGEDRDNRAIARSLVKMGEPAIPALEEALDLFEARGNKSEVASEAQWLLLAYARIDGPVAFPRLRRMIGNPRLVSYASALDSSVALAFEMTSYITSFREMGEIFHQCSVADSDSVTLSNTPCKAPSHEVPMGIVRCNRGEEPRDALDRLIASWETGDRLYLETSLGTRARAVLDQLVNKRPWAKMRAQFWPLTGRRRVVGVGYRFGVTGRWSEPDENLEELRPPGNLGGNYVDPEIETQFMNSAGGACGKFRLKFSSIPMVPFPDGPRHYSVDNADLEGLLRLIVSCAIATPAQ